jgi:hypothetical protein
MNKIESAFKEMMEDVHMSFVMIAYCMKDKARQLERELTAVTEQRDGLAEAMRQMWPFIEEDDYPNCNTPEFNAAILKYKQALQSLTTNA